MRVGQTMVEATETDLHSLEQSASSIIFAELLPALLWLDRRTEQAINVAPAVFGPKAAGDLYQGLYISRDEAERLLMREPSAPLFPSSDADTGMIEPDQAGHRSRLAWLEQAFGLTTFDIDVTLIALVPELDRRYERLYAYLQDHVSRRRPNVDLALNLLCEDAATRLERRVHFDPNAPLIRHHLVHLIPEADHDQPSLLAHTLKLDEQLTRFLLHQDGLDTRLASFWRLEVAATFLENVHLDGEMKQARSGLVDRAWNAREPLSLYFYGPLGVGKRQTAAALAIEAGACLLTVDLAGAQTANLASDQLWALMVRAAWFENSILYLDRVDLLRSDTHALAYARRLDALPKMERGSRVRRVIEQAHRPHLCLSRKSLLEESASQISTNSGAGT